MKTIHVPVAEAAKAALEAYVNGKLGFQSEESARSGSCQYRYPNGHVCAIGAYFAKIGFNPCTNSAVSVLANDSLIDTDDLLALYRLQSRHDKVCFDIRDGIGPAPRIEEFLTYAKKLATNS